MFRDCSRSFLDFYISKVYAAFDQISIEIRTRYEVRRVTIANRTIKPNTRYTTAPLEALAINVPVLLNKSKLEMEVDTGAALSVISKSTYDQMWSDESAPPLKPAAAKLKTYTGEQIRVVGAITVEVEHNHQQKRLGLLVVAGKGPSLLGRDWLSKITLSRLPLPESLTQITPPGETILVTETLQTSPIKASQIKQWTDHDPVLAVVRDKLLQGWTHTDDEQMKPYQRRRDELSIQDGCILWGNRVVIPPPGRAKVIEELHEGHPGATRMKALARS